MNKPTVTLSLLSILAAFACGPRLADDAGDDAGTGDTGGEAAPPDSTGPIVCVEMSPGAVTCWVDWAPGVDATVLLPCQVALGISGGAWGLPYDSTLEGWGLVTCHDITGTDNALCLYGDYDVLLTRETGLWLPQTNTQISNFPAVAAPCGDDPGDGDGDPGDGDPGDGDPGGDGDGDPIDQCTAYPGSLGCECLPTGPGAPSECLENLDCLDGFCTSCPDGQLGCSCSAGECVDGLGCTVGDTCVDCDFVTGVSGCACNISDECEGTSLCIDGMCGPH